jgi:3',5'-nucleoside bisphosphate phosphatase
VVTLAASFGVRRISITDHDTLAAYRWRAGAVFDEARRLGVELVVGVEMDVALGGREVHLLGLGLDPAAPALSAHLDAVRDARRERARRELALVRGRLGEDALAEDDVFVPGRDSLMRPHLIRPLVAGAASPPTRRGGSGSTRTRSRVPRFPSPRWPGRSR